MINLIEVDNKKPLIYYESELVKSIVLNNEYLYKLEEEVTYKVDSNVTYTEIYNYGEDILSPISFYPMKAGWDFIGWRGDSSPEITILEEKTLGLSPVTLYAVFEKTTDCSFISYGNVQIESGIQLYNNGNKSTFDIIAPLGTYYDGWNFLGWETSISATSHPDYEQGDIIYGISEETKYYGIYSREITLTYNANGGIFDNGMTTRTEVDTMYWSSHGSSIPARFYLTHGDFERENYIFKGWSLLGETYPPNAGIGANSVSLSYNSTCYAIWEYDPPEQPENPGGGSSSGSSKKEFDGDLYCWNGPEDKSKWYGGGYDEYSIYVHATKDDEYGRDPIELGGTIYDYGYVEMVGTNGYKYKIVGNMYSDKEGSRRGSLSEFGGQFYLRAHGYAGEVSYEGTLYK